MMKTLIKAAVAATVATGLFASPAFAAPNTDKADFTAKAKIVKAVTLVKDSDLDFGTITMLNTLTSQTVTVGQDNSKDCGGGDLTCAFPAQASAGFTVTGVPTQALTVSLVAPTVLKTVAGDTVAFRADAPSSVTVASTGSVIFGIGGEIDVVSATKDGSYNGDLTVTVTYQ
jgi:spore coat protein U-like protein